MSAWFIRASLCHLTGGFLLGALLLVERGVPFAPGVWVLRPAHVEMLLWGWIIQLTMGVALWILPRASLRREATRWAVGAWLAFLLLNAGVVLVSVGATAAGRLCEIGAAASLVAHVWRRVSPLGLSQM